MISLTEAFIESAAPNADAVRNGRGLVSKKSFNALHRSEDDTLLFGQCKGSGKTPYHCSADFQVPESPVYRCSCPSRQFPCKHALGLLFAYVGGQTFTPAAVPDDLAGKREKLQKRVEKKSEAVEILEKPRKVNKAALAKKLQAQLDGLDVLERLTLDLTRLGLGNLNVQSAHEIEVQAKQLGDAYLPGAQTALHSLTRLFQGRVRRSGAEQSSAERESVYSEALDSLNRMHSLVRQGRAYLKQRLDDSSLAPETDSAIAAWLGHAWTLRELKEAGRVENHVELVQLAFNTYDDTARKEFVDAGLWINLQHGQIQTTLNYRPYKAAKFIRSEDSSSEVAQIPELAIYPGDLNPRIRWDSMTPRPLTPADFQTVRSLGKADFAAVLKEVKAQLKSPLADRQPVCLLNYQKLGKVGEDYVLEDAKGVRLVLTDNTLTEEPASCPLLTALPTRLHANQSMLVRFRHDLDTRTLRVKPLSLVTDAQLIRLTL